MANAVFYLIQPEADPQFNLIDFVCRKTAGLYREQHRLLVWCKDQIQAKLLDERLWSFEPDSFIAHNLAGEGPENGAPVEISWPNHNHALSGQRSILINLAPDVPQFAVQFAQIFDFVAANEDDKVQARKRFASYRQLGITPTTQSINPPPV